MALQFELTDTTGAPVADISEVSFNKKVTPRLNLPATASCKCVTDGLPENLEGEHRLKVRLDGDLIFNGPIWDWEDAGDENTVYTELTAIDPMVFWGSRPARDADGDFSKPAFMQTFTTAPQIVEEILGNSITYEGALGIVTGSFATGGVNVSGAPVDWPMTVAQIVALLMQTGELDLVLSPSDTTDGVMATVDGYNGDYGADLTGSVSFDYQTGQYNARSIRRHRSMSTVCNKLWYYLGPRVGTSADVAGDQHWKGSITGDGMPDGAGGSVALPNPPGGGLDYSNPLGDLIAASRSAYGVLMNIRIFDGEASVIPYLYARLWQKEMQLRVTPRELLQITPIRGLAPSFGIGDLITVNAGPKLRGGFTGAVQRVYAYTISEDDDGVPAVTDIVCSPDQETL